MAETTTMTSFPASRVRTTRSATASIRSTEPTDVPPNFMTTMGMRRLGLPVSEPPSLASGPVTPTEPRGMML